MPVNLTPSVHTPVLLQETLDGLSIEEKDIVLDATLGSGAMSRAFSLILGEQGTLIGIDLDRSALKKGKILLEDAHAHIHLVHSDFKDLKKALPDIGIHKITKAIFDLGLSSDQLENSGRGFSFQKDEPLLMTFDDTPEKNHITAALAVNTWSEAGLADIFLGFGGETRARTIAKAIVSEREKHAIATTQELVRIIEKTVRRRGKVHPATKVFQALRMAVNDEVGALEKGLFDTLTLLKSKGRVAVISFESVTDRIVKQFFRKSGQEGEGRVLTKKPIRPKEEEVLCNPRARSAKLRIFEKS